MRPGRSQSTSLADALRLDSRGGMHGSKRVQSVAAVRIGYRKTVHKRECEIAKRKPVVDVPKKNGKRQVHSCASQTGGNFRPSGDSRTLNIHAESVEADFLDGNVIEAGNQNVTKLMSQHAEKNKRAFGNQGNDKGYGMGNHGESPSTNICHL